MKKYCILCCIIIFFFWNCSYRQSNKLEQNCIIPKENIQTLLDSFIKENRHEGYIYELYIDKISPDSCNLILYAGESSLTEMENRYYKQTSFIHIMESDIKINIYSGIERYFETCTNKEPINFDTIMYINPSNDRIIWVIKDKSGVFDVQKVYSAYPFIPLPLNIDFTYPELSNSVQEE